MTRNFKTLIVFAICLTVFGLSVAARHKPTAQEQAYSALSALPVSARRDTFRAMANEQRSEMWHTHLAKALSRNLTTEQRDIIARAIALATPEFFAHHGNLDSLTIKDTFTGKDAREIFTQLGGPEPRSHHAIVSPSCECSHSSDYCSTNCFGNGCTVSEYGCGTLWVYSCDGLCRVAEGDGYGGLQP